MGGSSSSLTTTNIQTNVLMDVLRSTHTECFSNISQTNNTNLNLHNCDGFHLQGGGQRNILSLSGTCGVKDVDQQTLENSLQSAIAQNASSDEDGLTSTIDDIFSSHSDSKADITNVTNDIKLKFSDEKFFDCVNGIKQSNNADVNVDAGGGPCDVVDVWQENTLKIFQSCFADNQSILTNVNKLTDDVKQAINTKTRGIFDFLNGPVIVGIIVVAAAVIIFFAMSHKSHADANTAKIDGSVEPSTTF